MWHKNGLIFKYFYKTITYYYSQNPLFYKGFVNNNNLKGVIYSPIDKLALL